MVWLGFKQELNQVYFIIIIYRNKTQHFLLFRLDGVKRNFIVPVCYYCYYTLNLWSVSFLSLISSIPWSVLFLDQFYPWSYLPLISSSPWSVLPLIRFTLDQIYPWLVLFLDQFYSLISSFPWSVLFLDQSYSLISLIPWWVLFLDQFYPWLVLFLDQFYPGLHHCWVRKELKLYFI